MPALVHPVGTMPSAPASHAYVETLVAAGIGAAIGTVEREAESPTVLHGVETLQLSWHSNGSSGRSP